MKNLNNQGYFYYFIFGVLVLTLQDSTYIISSSLSPFSSNNKASAWIIGYSSSSRHYSQWNKIKNNKQIIIISTQNSRDQNYKSQNFPLWSSNSSSNNDSKNRNEVTFRSPDWANDDDDESTKSSSAATIKELSRDDHVALLDSNLRRYTNKGLFQHMFGDDDDDDDDDNDDSTSTTTTSNKKKKIYHEWDDIHMSMRFVLSSHGSINGLDGPVNTYANFGACSIYQLGRGELLNFPACRMASPEYDDQIVWSEFLQKLRTNGEEYGPDDDDNNHNFQRYSGYRCTLMDRRRFKIKNALVWNCFDTDGSYYGQAILFDREQIEYDGE